MRPLIFAAFFLFSALSLDGKTYQFPPLEQTPQTQAYLNDPYTDHIPIFDYFFSKVEVSSFLEFGLGKATRFFLENCDAVTSFELLVPSQNPDWYTHCVETYQEYPNWTPILHIGSEAMEQANLLGCQSLVNPALYDGSYLLEIKDLCETMTIDNHFDVVFVDPGVHFRGDIVNEFFGKAPIIIAHDTAYGHAAYGWDRISTPFDYVRIDYPLGCGTTFWIHKSKEEAIRALLPDYTPQEKKALRIFFPEVHGDMTKSMGLLCKHLGHTLLLPGASFHLETANKGPKIYYGALTEERSNFYKTEAANFGGAIQVIENDEIFTDPPNVLFVNCKEVEIYVKSLYNLLKPVKNDIKLAHYSGNDFVPYEDPHNLISTDATTPGQYNPLEMHYAYWIPWIDWSSIEFSGPSDTPNLNAYLGLHYQDPGFFPARDLHQEYTKKHPQLFHLIPPTSQESIFEFMDQSLGTIHIKNKEGTGFTILQSLAKGRPVFLKRSFSIGKRLMNWCIEGETAIFFDTEEEFQEKIERFVFDPEYRHHLQTTAAKQIRRIVDNERQALIFENFLQNLE